MAMDTKTTIRNSTIIRTQNWLSRIYCVSRFKNVHLSFELTGAALFHKLLSHKGPFGFLYFRKN